MTPPPRSTHVQTVALGIVIGLAIAVAVVGGTVAVVLFADERPVAVATSSSTVAPTAAPVTQPRVSAQAPSPSPSPSSAAVSTVPVTIAPTAAHGSVLSSSQASASMMPSGPRAVVDAALLQVLPASVGGLAVEEYPDAEDQAITDPDLGRNIARVATAFVGDAGGSNWAYTAIVDVRPEARSEEFYRDWQETFDQSACERAGGVTGHTSVTIAGHAVERTLCGGGVRTYHVRIAGNGLLVSISDLGDAMFGEQEIAALKP